MKRANPYLNFDGNSEEAFTFYKSVFGGDFLTVMRFEHFSEMEGMPPLPEAELDKIAHISLQIGGSTLMGNDVLESLGQSLTVGNNVYIALEPDSADEARELFDALSAGGRVEMELQETDWAERSGSFTDRFGIQWMINYGGSKE